MFAKPTVLKAWLTDFHDPGYVSHNRRYKIEREAMKRASASVAAVGSPTDMLAATTRNAYSQNSNSMPLVGQHFEQKPKPIGKIVEKAVRFCLAMQVKLDYRNIAAWRERNPDGDVQAHYRELDAVHQVDYDTICLYEIKFKTLGLMQDWVGLTQLDQSASVLRCAYRNVKKRLVYVGYALDRISAGLPEISAHDTDADTGVVWVTPSQVEAAADSLGIVLPYGWDDLEARYSTSGQNEQGVTVTSRSPQVC